MIRIKNLYKGTRIAFGASGLPLGKRSKEDILDLAIIAQDSKNPNILVLFEGDLPPLDELKKIKLQNQIAKAKQKIKELDQGKK
jgi:hypothetical protein